MKEMRAVRPDDLGLDDTTGEPAVIRTIAGQLRRVTPDHTLKAIYEFLKCLNTGDTSWNSPDRGRWTSVQILQRKIAWGCSAHAQVACHLVRACGIPAQLVKALDVKWIEDENCGDGRGSGHVYVEVLIDERPCLWDAQGGRLHSDYNPESVLFERRLLYEKGGPDTLILSHHGAQWENETRRLFPRRRRVNNGPPPDG